MAYGRRGFRDSVSQYDSSLSGFSKDINEACFILAAPSICGSFAEKLQKYYPESPVIPREQVSEEIIYAIQFLAKTQQEDFIAEQAYLQILLAKSLPYLELAERGTMEGSGFVYQSVCYIAEHFKEDFSLSQMASDLGVSKYVLSRLFSNTFHTNFIKYTMRCDLTMPVRFWKIPIVPLQIFVWRQDLRVRGRLTAYFENSFI